MVCFQKLICFVLLMYWYVVGISHVYMIFYIQKIFVAYNYDNATTKTKCSLRIDVHMKSNSNGCVDLF